MLPLRTSCKRTRSPLPPLAVTARLGGRKRNSQASLAAQSAGNLATDQRGRQSRDQTKANNSHIILPSGPKLDGHGHPTLVGTGFVGPVDDPWFCPESFLRLLKSSELLVLESPPL